MQCGRLVRPVNKGQVAVRWKKVGFSAALLHTHPRSRKWRWALRELGPERDLDSALSHVETRRANGARRTSRCLRPRPRLRDFTKAIPSTNTQPAEGWANGKAAPTPSVTPTRRELRAREAEADRQRLAQQAGIAGLRNTKSSDGNAKGPCRSAACFGVSPVASARGFKSRRDPALSSDHSTTALPAAPSRLDISIGQRLGHFFLASTCPGLVNREAATRQRNSCLGRHGAKSLKPAAARAESHK